MEVKLRILKELEKKQPRKSTDFIKELGVNKNTFYSALKKLETGGFVKNVDGLISKHDYNSEETKIENALRDFLVDFYDRGDGKINEAAFYEPNVLQVLRTKHFVDEIAFKVGTNPNSKFKKILWNVAKNMSRKQKVIESEEDLNKAFNGAFGYYKKR